MTKVELWMARPRWFELLLTGLIGPPTVTFLYSILFFSVVQNVSVILSVFAPLLGLILIAFLVAGTWLGQTLAARVAFVLVAGTVSVVTFVLVVALVGNPYPP
jgi:hypothetical protein